MAHANSNLAELASKVLSGSAEDDIRDALRGVMGFLGAKDTGKKWLGNAGEADMVLEEWAVLVESKARKVKDFSKSGSGASEGESAVEQLSRYHSGLKNDTSYSSQAGKWLGVITNGEKWEGYQWVGENQSATLFASRTFSDGEAEEMAVWIENLLKHRRRYLPVPSKVHRVFSPYCQRLISIEIENINEVVGKSYDTQRNLWLEMLKGAGMSPLREKEALFRRHCFLIVLARLVEASMLKNGISFEDFVSERMNGFVSWISMIENGRSWLGELYSCVMSYDWSGNHRDVLRDIYESTISKEQRHAFGEFYTPDWLAEMIVEKVLDDEWLKRSLSALKEPQKGYGILDPACGSGTFLFHAAKRILKWLSSAPEAKLLEESQKADIVANLVVGIDIHPVAAELAKITLLTAFPPGVLPNKGRDALRVFQGDALLAEWDSQALLWNPNNGDSFDFVSPGNLNYSIPKFFARRSDFQKEIKMLIDSAVNGNKEPPQHLLAGTNNEKQQIMESYGTLLRLVDAEENGVWAWRIFNSVSPVLVAEQKVDRIVANPPWVRMSDIKDDRKEVVSKLMSSHGIWVGERMATSNNIAALFVMHTAEEYLICGRGGNFACGWVLPWGSLRGGNWAKLKEKILPETLDLARISQSPFSDDACVWYEGQNSEHRKNTILDNKNEDEINTISTLLDNWSSAKSKLLFSDMKIPDFRKSDYLSDKTSSFRQGATLYPHSLIKINESQEIDENRLFVKAQENSPSGKKWVPSGIHAGTIPLHWLREAVQGEHLFPFALRKPFSFFCIPLNEKLDALLDEKSMMSEKFWETADNYYKKNKGKGKTTEETLAAYIDHWNKLTVQLPRNNSWIVIYNKSGGDVLRSARIKQKHLLFTDNIYWRACDNENEAKYLTALLNSDYLQPFFRNAKNSTRHFDQQIWRKVPIPKYNSSIKTHQALTELCSEAEKKAKKILQKANSTDQDEITKLIRQSLLKSEIMKKIDSKAKLIVK